MSLLNFLEMQPIEGYDDVSSSPNEAEFDDVIDLSHDTSGEELVDRLGKMVLDFQMDTLKDTGSK